MTVRAATAGEMISVEKERLRNAVAAAANEFVKATGCAVTHIEAEFLDTSAVGEESSTMIGEVKIRWVP